MALRGKAVDIVTKETLDNKNCGSCADLPLEAEIYKVQIGLLQMSKGCYLLDCEGIGRVDGVFVCNCSVAEQS